MTYREWYGEFARRHREIVKRIDTAEAETLIDYFRYENMRERHPGFCPLYAEGKRCHELENLNCYLCGCPHFRYCDEGIDEIGGKIRYSLCAIDAKEGKTFETDTAIHQDCSDCPLPHLSGFIRRHFDRDWAAVMAECEQCH
jgi:hypothetical protein